jgi:hypothetical protein
MNYSRLPPPNPKHVLLLFLGIIAAEILLNHILKNLKF